MTKAPSTTDGARPPRRYLALWLPFLPTDRLKQQTSGADAPAEEPFVLVAKQANALRLTAGNEAALKLGLSPGLTLADARARIPHLVVGEADPAGDERLLVWLAALCDRFTPLVALDPPCGLVLDITGCAHLFGGEAGLCAHLARRLARLGLAYRIAVAGTPEAAHALCRHSAGGLCPPGQDEGRVRPLPVVALRIGSEATLALSRAGLKRIGDLADRPSVALSARFGEIIATRLRRVLGHEDIRITPLRPPPDCMAERQFAEPLMDAAGVEDVVARLFDEVAKLLERRGEGGRAFEISIFRLDGAVRRIVIETGRPSRNLKTLLRLYREKCEALADPFDPGFGFDAVRLSVLHSEILTPAQVSLDQRTVEEDAMADLIDRLIARFGRERVLRFVARDSHDPRRDAGLISASDRDPHAIGWPAPEPDSPPGRPLQLFEPPQPIDTLAEIPDGPPLRFRWRRVLHEIARAEGPERIAPEWWRDGPQPPLRDYYRVEDAEGRRFWLFRAGLYGEGTEPPRWFLHGLFA